MNAKQAKKLSDHLAKLLLLSFSLKTTLAHLDRCRDTAAAHNLEKEARQVERLIRKAEGEKRKVKDRLLRYGVSVI